MTPEWLSHRGSPSTRWPSPRTCRFQQLGWCSTEKSLSGERRVLEQILAEMTERLQPLQNQLKKSAVPHQHKLVGINVVMVITIMFCSRWQYSMLPTEPLQGHNLVSTTAATRVLEDYQEKEPPITREKLLSKPYRHSLIEDFRQDKVNKHFQSCLEEQANGRPRRRRSSRKPMRCFLMGGAKRQLSESRRQAS